MHTHIRIRLFAALAFAAAAAGASFTLEQVLSAPFPSSPVAAPAGGKVAWVLNARGVRNIWVAETPDYRGRRVTEYAEDDGQEIGQLQWTPDGRAIVYVRGGDAGRGREVPNPLSSPQGAEQAIWIVAPGEKPKRLAEGHSPAISPKGERTVYLTRNQVWSVALAGAEKPAPLIQARGNCESLRWSPDGTRLAFVNSRGTHSFIGVYDLASKSLRYLDPGVDRDGSPVWSPDGARIAFVRIPAAREIFAFAPRRSAQPWSIRVASVADGRGREIWRAQEGRGSAFRPVVADNQLLWGAGDRLAFPWEREGWTQLYSVSVEGGAATALTAGEFEVEDVLLAPDRRHLLLSSNQDDIDRRHIWRAPLTGGKPVPVTKGSGIEWAPVMTADGQALAFLCSDARRPPRAAIQVGASAPRDLAPETIPAEFPEGALVAPEPVVISAADGMRIHCQLFLPPGARPGARRPAVLFFHGGSRRQMLLGWHYRYYYRNAYAMNQFLASRGYVVLSVNYRSGIGYGLEFREAINYGARGASEFNDVLGAGLYLRSRPDVDAARIGLWGGSYGGYLTALGLARASDLFAAGVDLHGVHDWNVVIRNFAPSYDPEAQRDAARVAFESSPMAHIKTWRSPVLLVHGDDDRNVPFSETVALAEALRRQGVEFEQLIFPDEVHDFLTHRHWLEALGAAFDFLERRLARGGQAGR